MDSEGTKLLSVIVKLVPFLLCLFLFSLHPIGLHPIRQVISIATIPHAVLPTAGTFLSLFKVMNPWYLSECIVCFAFRTVASIFHSDSFSLLKLSSHPVAAVAVVCLAEEIVSCLKPYSDRDCTVFWNHCFLLIIEHNIDHFSLCICVLGREFFLLFGPLV